MRFTVSVLGTEVFSISTDKPSADRDSHGEHDTNCSQVEIAAEVPVGFHVQAIPSLNEVRA